MSLSGVSHRNLWLAVLFFAGLAALFVDATGDVGLLGPDEPRYASIGREMAVSGDWITPRLWGSPWYEKPPLLYWLIAGGHALGLGDDLAPRVPVALFSVLFLALQFFLLVRLHGERIAWMATLLLSTTAGWSAYSQIGVTDLPLAVTFSAALLLGALWLETGARPALLAAAASLALAVLAKGLVPLVLALPLLWFARRRWRQLAAPALLFLLFATPWFAAMLALHGRPFFDEFFVRHHLARFASAQLMHVQPFWFYLPVLIGGLFPWSVMLATLGPHCWRDPRLRLPAATFAFGFLFFSLSSNKLPGYLMPLLPSLAVLLAAGADTAKGLSRRLALTALLVSLCPVVTTILPEALLYGLRRANPGELHWEYVAFTLPLAAAAWWLENRGRRLAAFALVAVLSASGLWFVKRSAAPVLDQLVSPRSLWRSVEPHAGSTCIESLHRNWRYGLNYYSRQPLPDCASNPRPFAVVQPPGALPRIQPLRQERGQPLLR